jgi:hypothetical protein
MSIEVLAAAEVLLHCFNPPGKHIYQPSMHINANGTLLDQLSINIPAALAPITHIHL